MVKISIELDDKGAMATLNALESGLTDFSEFNSEAASMMEAGVKEYYAREEGTDGAWAPLAPSTLRAKRSSAILRETGAMISAVTSDYTREQARVRNSMNYAIFSQMGTSRQPQRRHIGFSSRLAKRLRKAFAKYVSSLT